MACNGTIVTTSHLSPIVSIKQASMNHEDLAKTKKAGS